MPSNTPPEMDALYFEKTGSLANLRVARIPLPTIDPAKEALVRVRAAAINPSDPKNVLGRIPETRVPRVPGRDFSGTVVDGPRQWVGKHVLGTGGDLGFRRNGSHAEFLAVPVEALVEKPDDLTFEQAAAVGLSFLTAWIALVRAGQVSADDTIAILGAAGSVGSAAVKIARHRGVKRILGLLKDETERKNTRDVPAHEWIVLDASPLPQSILDATTGRGADLILDVVGGPIFELVNQALAPRGRHVVIGSVEPRVTFNLLDFYHREARLIGVDTLKLSFQESAAVLRELVPLIGSGTLAAPELASVPIREAAEAYATVLEGRTLTKQVLSFPERQR